MCVCVCVFVCVCVCVCAGFYLGIKFWGGSLSITVNDCTQDMHIDLMHLLYVYSRVMGGGGGGGYLQSIVGGQVHVLCGILDIFKTHAVL